MRAFVTCTRNFYFMFPATLQSLGYPYYSTTSLIKEIEKMLPQVLESHFKTTEGKKLIEDHENRIKTLVDESVVNGQQRLTKISEHFLDRLAENKEALGIADMKQRILKTFEKELQAKYEQHIQESTRKVDALLAKVEATHERMKQTVSSGVGLQVLLCSVSLVTGGVVRGMLLNKR